MSIFKTIEISYKWDRDNFLKSFENSYEFMYKNSARRYIGWLFIAMVQFGVVFALKGGRVGLLMFATILIVYWYYVKKILVKKRALKHYEKSPLRDSIIKLIVKEDGVEQNSNIVSWKDIDGVVELDDNFLLYLESVPHYIPSDAFKSLDERVRFKDILKEKGKFYV